MILSTWQDWTLCAISYCFIWTLIPMIRTRHAPPLSTSLPTVGLILLMAYVELTLGLWLTAIASVVTAGLWAYLARIRWTR